MKRMYLHDTCIALGVDSATLYRWMKRAGIQVQKDEIDKRKHYITPADVRTLARLHRKQLPNIYDSDAMQMHDNDERFVALESKLAALQKRVDELEKQLKTQPTIAKPRVLEHDTPAVSSTLPDGLIGVARFAQNHAKPGRTLPDTSIRRAIKNGDLKPLQGSWIVGNNPVKFALDKKGQAQFYHLFHAHQNFQPCPHCPHNTA